MKNIDISIDEQGVATLVLDRPEVLNALNVALMTEALDALGQLADDPEVKVLIITGRGRAFCAGADLGDVGDGSTPGACMGEKVASTMRAYFNPFMERIYQFPKPTLCAVNGVAAGGGAALALCADVVVAGRDAKLVFVQVSRLGIVADLGANWLLPRIIGRGRAMGACLLGEQISAEQLLAWGLVWECVDGGSLLPRARELASRLALLPAETVLATRNLIDDAPEISYAEMLERERLAQRELCDLPVFTESVARFLSR